MYIFRASVLTNFVLLADKFVLWSFLITLYINHAVLMTLSYIYTYMYIYDIHIADIYISVKPVAYSGHG